MPYSVSSPKTRLISADVELPFGWLQTLPVLPVSCADVSRRWSQSIQLGCAQAAGLQVTAAVQPYTLGSCQLPLRSKIRVWTRIRSPMLYARVHPTLA